MVLEALAAVGLAGNIAQFIDFSRQLFSTAASIQRSHDGAAQSVQDIETIAQALNVWSKKITESQKNALQHHPSLLQLGELCQIAVDDLLSATRVLKAKNPDSKWSNFKAALATTWSEKKIRDMENRLNAYRQQMALEVALLQSEDHKHMWESLNRLDMQSHQLSNNLLRQISGLKADITFALAALRRDLGDARTGILQFVSPSSPLQESRTNLDHSSRTALTAMLANCQSKASDMVVTLTILNTLKFERMHYRHAAVVEAHPGTFGWVFEDEFCSWLRSSDPIFWISGKPGSGKSTMMKFLVSNPQTQFALEDWSSPHRLVMADYFFWINGTELERSLEGLLRALLYDILRQTPTLVMSLLPETWRLASDHLAMPIPSMPWEPPVWTKEVLMSAFQRLSLVENMNTRFCLFIDGLDEYRGCHEDLIQTVRLLTRAGVKLCVASRPWNIFEDAFGSEKTRKLYLQDLNRPDIQKYVDEKLRAHVNFPRIAPAQADEIANEVIDKSQGVFLWVRLAVTSLVEGLRNRDPITILRKRLHEFPSDLEEFFRHMFTSLEKVYRPHLSHMFQVALTTTEPLSPIAFWCLDELYDQPDLALMVPMHATRAPKTAHIIEDVTIRINGRSRGLLEVTCCSTSDFSSRQISKAYANARVDFLHRTVKDFIMTTEIHAMLKAWQEPHFDVDVTLCNMLSANIDIVVSRARELEGLDTLKNLLKLFFTCAARIELHTRESPIAQIQELERIAAEYRRVNPQRRFGLWNILGRSSLLSIALDYNMPNFFVNRMRLNATNGGKIAKCVELVLVNESLWKPNATISSESDGLSEQMRLLLSTEPPAETHTKFHDALFDRLDQLEPQQIISLMEAFAKYSIIDQGSMQMRVLERRLLGNLSRREEEKLRLYVHSLGSSNKVIAISPAGGHILSTTVSQNDTLHDRMCALDTPSKPTPNPKPRRHAIREGMRSLSRKLW